MIDKGQDIQRKWLLVLVIAIVWAAGILTLLNYAYPRADGSLIRFYPESEDTED